MTLKWEWINGSEFRVDNATGMHIVRRARLLGTIPRSPVGDPFDEAASFALAWINQNQPTYSTTQGTLFANDLQLHESRAAQRYEVSVNYGPHDRQTGAYQITVDQTGGTAHVTAGVRIGGFGPSADEVDNGGLIGVDGDRVHGVDIPIEQPKISVMYRHPQAYLNRNYIRAIGMLVGHPSNDTFLGYAAGEVLFLGGNFTESNTEATATYNFAISYHATFMVGSIEVFKYGWDVLSPTYEPDEDGGSPVRKIKYVETIRPAGKHWLAYAPVFGWGAT